jgi:hypothetical protein
MERTTIPIERSSWSSRRVAACLFVALAGGTIGAVVGLTIGANYGANHATRFQFARLRGYEATGLIGALAGLATIGVPNFYLVRRLTSGWSGPAAKRPVSAERL